MEEECKRPMSLVNRSSLRGIRATSLVRISPFSTSRLVRQFHDTTNKQSTTTVNNVKLTPTPPSIKSNSLSVKAQTEYLKTFDYKELISFFIIGLATLNKPILNLCIKAFPYVPISVIKALVYRIYCGGETINEVQETGEKLSKRGINNMMISLTIEACNGNDNIDPEYIARETSKSVENILIPHTVKMIEESGKSINDIPAGYVALKPTGFAKDAVSALKYFKSDPVQAEKFNDLVAKSASVIQTIYDANKSLAEKYPERVAPFVVGVIDAEKFELQEGVYELQRRLYQQFNKLNEPVTVVGTLQMYLSGSADLLALEEQLAQKNNYRLGLKLVRGAYIHSEKDRATVIHKTKEDTDNNYNKGISYCIDNILNKEDSTIGHLVVASHNGESLKLASERLYNELTISNPEKNNVCLGQLLGMADSITYDLIKSLNINNVIKYVPWGPPLETKEYLLRRLEENGDAVKNDNGWPLVKASASVLFKRLFGLA